MSFPRTLDWFNPVMERLPARAGSEPATIALTDRTTMSENICVLSYNIQAGIGTTRAHQYVTRLHQQVISTKAKTRTLRNIGLFCAGFDVVCLQEVDLGGRRAGFENQVDVLKRASRLPHAAWQENRTVRRISRHGNAILSRARFVSCDDLKLPGKVGGRGALIVELDMEPQTVVVCAHLSLGLEDQTEQLEFLADRLSVPKWRAARKIVCGDLNCGAKSQPIQLFTERTRIRPLTTPQHKSYPSWSPRQALDHILSSESRPPQDVLVEDAAWSDHRPVSACFPANAVRG